MNSLYELKRRDLEERRAALIRELEAANKQWNSTLNEADKPRIENQIQSIEKNTQQVESQLSQLEQALTSSTSVSYETVPNGLSDREWRILMQLIQSGKCTPVIGSDVYPELISFHTELAVKWAEKYQYPLAAPCNFGMVAQFLAIKYTSLFPKTEYCKCCSDFQLPSVSDPLDVHNILASLPLPIYLTTNHHNFMVQALRRVLG